MESIIKLTNVCKSFGNVEVLKDINLEVFKGEHLALIGANGCGKSTLVEIILNTIEKSSGDIQYNFNKENIYKIFGTQFQEANYPSGLKVKDVVSFFEDVYDVNDKVYIDSLINGFNLSEIWKLKIKDLSGGQLQRVNIMLALIHKPKVLILDEITNGLDILARQQIKNFIKLIVKENDLTLIIISHNVEEIEELSDRVLFINNKTISSNLKVTDILEKYGSMVNYTNKIFGGS